MNKLIMFLTQNWIGVSIGIVGIVLTIKSQSRSSLSYQFQSLELIVKSKRILSKGIEILFDGKPVKSLTKTYIVLWNSGKKTIYGDSIVSDDPLRIEFDKNAQVLQTRIIKLNRKVNKFEVKIRKKSTNIIDYNFDYLDPGDGVTVEILHTYKKNCFKIRGTIKELPNGIKNLGKFYIPEIDSEKTVSSTISKIGIIFSNISVISAGLFFSIMSISSSPESKFVVVDAYIVLSSIIILMISYPYYWWTHRRRFPKALAVSDTDLDTDLRE